MRVNDGQQRKWDVQELLGEIEYKVEKYDCTSHTWILRVLLVILSPCICRDVTEKITEKSNNEEKITEQLPEKGLDRQGLFSPEKRHCRKLLTEL